ncbi:MAG: cysteine peptidase family C39 domain-containing protein [Methanoregulaceae archaeon]|nr:cysteine peptidase family C39 domain-containing protein [Methanoregulaceae archaeon]
MQRFPILTNTRQSTEYSCGAAALQAVLSHWGKDLNEKELIDLLHTSPETGTYVGDIVRVARMLGFKAELHENVTLSELHTALKRGESVIVCSQAWRSREDSDRSVQEDWEDGHYVVVLGMDEKYVYYQDPFIKRGKGFVTHQKFDESWHNVRGKTTTDAKKQVHLGVFISGTSPPPNNPMVSKDITKGDLSKFGPLQLVNIRFEGAILPYDVMKPMDAILNRELIRPIAYLVLNKEMDGTIGVLEGGDMKEEEAVEIDAILGYLIGLGAGGPETAETYAKVAEQRAVEHTFGVSEGDLQRMAEELPPNSSVILLILEHIWAKKIKEVLANHGGSVTSQGMITPDMLIRWGARLQEAGKSTPN